MRFLRRGLLRACAIALLASILVEIPWHIWTFRMSRPSINLDEPFYPGQHCKKSNNVTAPRRNAVLFMLARNSDLQDAVLAVRSLERRFNHAYQYPYVFANDEPWTKEFQQAIRAEISSNAVFETIPEAMWGFRSSAFSAEREKALQNMAEMEVQDVPHAGDIGYHNMCRFHSGFFFDLPSLQSYDWYWRLEPDARFLCDVPYDPFDEMITRNKRYGYVMALWEVGSTAPSLFRAIDEYRRRHGLRTGQLWAAMHEASWAPIPIRQLIMSMWPSRNRHGDGWNLCHFWSNFEIADLSFFRSREYRRLFEYLDAIGGFHLERWGDAAVHSLALALFLSPSDLHFFEDIGYKHTSFQHSPHFSIGCNCHCDPDMYAPGPFCLARLREAVDSKLDVHSK